MTHTEEEAKKLWCPAARLGEEAGCNRAVAYSDKGAFCLGAGCMMWRWASKPNPDWKPDHSGMGVYPPRDIRSDPPMYIDDETRGFCGLAGRP